MSFTVRFLGTGTAFSRAADNYHNNAIVDTGSGLFLIDCGATAPQALHELGIKPWDLDGIVITHLHGDHCGGIEQIAWERYYTGPYGPGFLKTPVFVHPDLEIPIKCYLWPLMSPYTDPAGNVSSDWSKVIEVKLREWFSLGGVSVALARTPHVKGDCHDKPAYGLMMTDACGVSAYYSGDTVFTPELFEQLAAVPVLFHECVFYPKHKGTVHTHFEELLTLPEKTRKKIVLMHYGVIPTALDVEASGFYAAKRFEEFHIDETGCKRIVRSLSYTRLKG